MQWGIETARAAARAHGRDPDSLRFGAYVNMACHPDIDTARRLVSGGLTTFARFSVMHGDIAGPVDEREAEVLNALHDRYNMKQHTRGDSQQAEVLTPEFIDRFAVVGDPEQCLRRIEALGALGLDKLAVTGPTVSAREPDAQQAIELLTREVLPQLAS
ncbi:MAG: LLM class flavin-dependent oxidoreductase [Pseudomonadales bacterium]